MAEQIQLTQEQAQTLEKEVLASKISINMTVKDVNVILNILGKYPFDEVASVVTLLQNEGQPQVRKLVAEIEAKYQAEAEKAAPQE